MSQRINYDEIAKVYDRDSYREKQPDPNFEKYMRERQGPLGVLDIGCGTGSQLIVHRKAYPQHHYTGLDYSSQMLAVAKSKDPRVEWVQGDAQSLPFKDSTFDFVSSQYHIHHVPDKSKMLTEVWRVLKKGGWLVVTNSVPFEMKDWPVYQYFPETYERDESDYLNTRELIGLAEEIGFHVVSSQTERKVTQIPAPEFLRDVRTKQNCSQLIALPEKDFLKGLARLEEDFKTRTEPVEITIPELTLVLGK